MSRSFGRRWGCRGGWVGAAPPSAIKVSNKHVTALEDTDNDNDQEPTSLYQDNNARLRELAKERAEQETQQQQTTKTVAVTASDA